MISVSAKNDARIYNPKCKSYKSYGEISNVSHTDTSQYNTAYYHKQMKTTEADLMLFTERSRNLAYSSME